MITRAEAAFIAFTAMLRKGHGTRAVADALAEMFEAGERDDWQAQIVKYRHTAGYAPMLAAACQRFDLTP